MLYLLVPSSYISLALESFNAWNYHSCNLLFVRGHGVNRLCGLVVRAPGCRSRGPGSVPGTTTFYEKKWVWNGGSLSLVSTNEELLDRKVAASFNKTEITTVGDSPRWLRDIPLSAMVGTNFAVKRGSLGLIVRSRTKDTELRDNGLETVDCNITLEPYNTQVTGLADAFCLDV
jgi:hypothetical protein